MEVEAVHVLVLGKGVVSVGGGALLYCEVGGQE